MKTIEEMKASIHAFCLEVCKEIGPDVAAKLPNGMILERDQNAWSIFASLGEGHGLTHLVVFYPDMRDDDERLLAFYALSGLSERDAVEAETERMTTAVLEAKNEAMMARLGANKLVEALEEIQRVPKKMQDTIDVHGDNYTLKTDEEIAQIIRDFGFGETEFHTADIERLFVQSRNLKYALAAHKKGGAGE